MMQMSFNFHNLTNFLFENVNIPSTGGGIAALFFIFVAAVCALEGIKYVKAYIRHKMNMSPVCFEPVHDQSPLVESLNLPPSLEHFKRVKLGLHACQSLIHFFEIVIAYVVMLAVMSYNVWVLLAVVTGSGLGYFIFGRQRQELYDTRTSFEETLPDTDRPSTSVNGDTER